MVFHWSLSDSKSPQVSWTLLFILADLNNVVVGMVFTCPLISKSFLSWNHILMCHICFCLPPDRAWHKVNHPKVDYGGGLEEGKVGHEPCWTMMQFAHPKVAQSKPAWEPFSLKSAFVGRCGLAWVNVCICASQVGWGCKINRLLIYRGGKTSPISNECPGYNTKPSNG